MAQEGRQRVRVQMEQATCGARIDVQGQHRDERQGNSGSSDAQVQILKLRQIHRTINLCERITRSNRVNIAGSQKEPQAHPVVILTKRAPRAGRKDLGQRGVSAAGSGFALLHAIRSAEERYAISKPVPASLARSCPRSFLPLALLATSG